MIYIWLAGALITLWATRHTRFDGPLWSRVAALTIVAVFWPVSWTVALVHNASVVED